MDDKVRNNKVRKRISNVLLNQPILRIRQANTSRGSNDVAFLPAFKTLTYEGEVPDVVVRGHGEAMNLSAETIQSA